MRRIFVAIAGLVLTLPMLASTALTAPQPARTPTPTAVPASQTATTTSKANTATPTATRPAAQTATATPGSVGSTKSFVVSPGAPATLSYAGATLALGADALTEVTTISITTLSQADVSALDEGMTNTTSGRSGDTGSCRTTSDLPARSR